MNNLLNNIFEIVPLLDFDEDIKITEKYYLYCFNFNGI